MKYALLSTLFFLLCSLSAQGQIDKGQQLVYFKDGTIIKGVIVEYRMNDKIVMRVGSRDIELPVSSVKFITRGKNSKKYEKKLKEETYPYAFKEKGLYAVSALSLNTGSDFDGSVVGLGASQVVGYQWNRWLGFGIGGSIEAFSFNGEKPFITAFGDLRGYLTETKTAPFYAFQAGYGFLNDQRIRDAEGGLMLYPAIGVRLGAREGANFSIDLGYKYQKSRREYGAPASYEVWNYRYRRYVFRVSLTY